MKKRILLWMAGLLFFSTSALLAQDVPKGVVQAFERGSSQELSKYLSDKVELVIQGDSKNLDKQKTGETLSRFFTDNKVGSFAVNHQGKRNESSFIIGTLTTTSGNFRVNCFFKKIQDKYLIHQIRIDKTK